MSGGEATPDKPLDDLTIWDAPDARIDEISTFRGETGKVGTLCPMIGATSRNEKEVAQ